MIYGDARVTEYVSWQTHITGVHKFAAILDVTMYGFMVPLIAHKVDVIIVLLWQLLEHDCALLHGLIDIHADRAVLNDCRLLSANE